MSVNTAIEAVTQRCNLNKLLKKKILEKLQEILRCISILVRL